MSKSVVFGAGPLVCVRKGSKGTPQDVWMESGNSVNAEWYTIFSFHKTHKKLPLLLVVVIKKSNLYDVCSSTEWWWW